MAIEAEIIKEISTGDENSNIENAQLDSGNDMEILNENAPLL